MKIKNQLVVSGLLMMKIERKFLKVWIYRSLLEFEFSKYAEELKPMFDKKFNNHPGKMDDIWVPFNRADALKNLDYFITVQSLIILELMRMRSYRMTVSYSIAL